MGYQGANRNGDEMIISNQTRIAGSPVIITPSAISANTFRMGGLGQTFTQLIKKLFANGEEGFWYDPDDLTTMWQDQAKLLPVTGEGQPVWHILDKSGNNNHAFATSSATRPILQRNATTGANYLEFDGVDDYLQTNNIDFTATDKVSLFAGVHVAAYADAMLLEFSSDINAHSRSFYITAPEFNNTFGRGYYSLSYGNSNLNLLQIAYLSQETYPDNAVLTVTHDISGSLSTIRRNGVKGLDGTAYKGTVNFGNYPLYIGRRGGHSLPFTGHIYGLIGIGRLTTDSETIALEKSIAKNVGVTLSV